MSRARTSLQSDPDTKHVTAGLAAMECVVIQDLFLNETASYAHVFLPGATFLEKDGTFTNAERRINRVRKAVPPVAGKADWEVTQDLSNALGYPMNYKHPSEIMDEIARLTPTFKGVSYAKLEELGSVQWPCNDAAPEGTPTMHIGAFRPRQGQVHASPNSCRPMSAPARASRCCSRPGASCRNTMSARRRGGPRTTSGIPRMCWRSIPMTRRTAASTTAIWISLVSRAGETALRARLSDRVQPGVVYTTFHHAESGANVVTTDFSDWATNCPEYKVTAVEVRLTNRHSAWQSEAEEFRRQTRRVAADAAE